jgi:hypothetical protein
MHGFLGPGRPSKGQNLQVATSSNLSAAATCNLEQLEGNFVATEGQLLLLPAADYGFWETPWLQVTSSTHQKQARLPEPVLLRA